MILAVFRISPAHQAGAVKCSVAGTKSVPGSQHGRGGWQGFLNSPEGTWPLLVSAQEVSLQPVACAATPSVLWPWRLVVLLF